MGYRESNLETIHPPYQIITKKLTGKLNCCVQSLVILHILVVNHVSRAGSIIR